LIRRRHENGDGTPVAAGAPPGDVDWKKVTVAPRRFYCGGRRKMSSGML
jgi:hypothetical protein